LTIILICIYNRPHKHGDCMYVCLCKSVTDTEIEQELQAGANSLCDLQRRLGVGTQCGGCCSYARDMVAEHHRQSASCQKNFR
jgi:bacterioferritin-associated ferredoxin